MFDVLVTQRVIPGREQEFEALVKQVEANTLANDEGCLRYEWYRSVEPHSYVLIERWTNLAAAQAHLKAVHMAALLPKIRDCVPEPFTITRLTKLGD
jgi:quinol monooxygenase YgiN